MFSGLQSLHTDSYDEVISAPTEEAARIAVATQNIIREEAHGADVIDPLAGSYYVETLTDQMEEKIVEIMDEIENAGGMFKAVESGLIQRWIGDSAMRFQQRVDNGEQTIVGVNKYQHDADNSVAKPLEPPSQRVIEAQLEKLDAFKANRNHSDFNAALDQLQRAAQNPQENIFAAIVEAVANGMTHGEVIRCVRQEPWIRSTANHPVMTLNSTDVSAAENKTLIQANPFPTEMRSPERLLSSRITLKEPGPS